MLADGEISEGEVAERKSIKENCRDVPQEVGREVFLYFAANPTDKKISFGSEYFQIDCQLSEKNIRSKFELVPVPGATFKDMIERIKNEKETTIVHFAGHGYPANKDSKKGGGLVVHANDYQGSKVIDTETLDDVFAKLKKSNPNLRIVILSACYSEPQAIAISKHDIYTIGVNDELNSPTCNSFAAGFYGQYPHTQDVLDAFSSGFMSARSDLTDRKLIQLFHNGQEIFFQEQST